MRIGFVAEPYEESGASGMGYLVLELLRELVKEKGAHTIVVYSSKPIQPDGIPGSFENILVLPKSFFKKFFWFLRFNDDVDALIFIAPLLPLWVPKKIKTVVICQD